MSYKLLEDSRLRLVFAVNGYRAAWLKHEAHMTQLVLDLVFNLASKMEHFIRGLAVCERVLLFVLSLKQLAAILLSWLL